MYVVNDCSWITLSLEFSLHGYESMVLTYVMYVLLHFYNVFCLKSFCPFLILFVHMN